MSKPVSRNYRRNFAMEPRKKVFSNRQLTKAVRSLKNTEGSRLVGGEVVYSAVSLAAGTADIDYLVVTPFTAGTCPAILHYTDFTCKYLCTAAGGATLRIIVGYDEHNDGADLAITEILQSPGTDSSSRLAADARTIKEARHKNANDKARCVVVYDRLISLIQNEPRTMQFRVNHYNRKLTENGPDDNLNPAPFMCLLADENIVLADVSANTAYTNLSN